MAFGRPRVTLKSRAQVEKMAIAGRLVGDALDAVGEALRPGVTPLELDALAERVIRSGGGIPSFIGVPGHLAPFRHSLCVSIDDEVVHGVPDERRIRGGQLVSVDAGAIVDGWHGDSARTWAVGDAGEDARRLVDDTRDAMLAGIAAAVPGNTLEDIGAAIEDVGLARGYGQRSRDLDDGLRTMALETRIGEMPSEVRGGAPRRHRSEVPEILTTV